MDESLSPADSRRGMFRYIVQTVSAGLVAKGYKKGYPFKNEWVSFCAFYKFLLLALDIIPIFLFLAIFLDVFLDIHERKVAACSFYRNMLILACYR